MVCCGTEDYACTERMPVGDAQATQPTLIQLRDPKQPERNVAVGNRVLERTLLDPDWVAPDLIRCTTSKRKTAVSL